jgi:hypothetical protein
MKHGMTDWTNGLWILQMVTIVYRIQLDCNTNLLVMLLNVMKCQGNSTGILDEFMIYNQ